MADAPAAHRPSPANAEWADCETAMRNGRLRKREVLIIIAAVASITLLVIYRQELMKLAPATYDYDRPDLSVEVMQQMVARSDPEDVPDVLERLWATRMLAQRRFVMAYLREQGVMLTPQWARVKPIVLEATLGPDAESISDALGLLLIIKEGQALMYAPAMVRDADPRVRWEWVNYVSQMGNRQYTDLLVPLLDDPAGAVASRAASAIAGWTDQLVDVRAEDEPQTRRSRSERFRAWWTQHKSEYAAASSLASAPRPEPTVSAYPFVLDDTGGQGVALRTLLDRVVVLHFFSTRAADSGAMLKTLGQLTASSGTRVHVVHVCTDQLDDVYPYDPIRRPLVSPGMNDLGVELPVAGGGLGEPLDATATIDAVEHAAATAGVKSPILIDSTGETTTAYAALAQPTCVVIDRSGMVRRRFSGPRGLATLRAMVRAVDPLTEPTDPLPPLPTDPLEALPTPTLDPPAPLEPGEPLPPLPPPLDEGERPTIPGLPPPPRPRTPPPPKPIEDAPQPDTPPPDAAAPASSADMP